MSRWLLPLLLAAVGLPGAQARDAFGAIDACLRQLDRNLDVGYQHIAARCPDLAPSLAQSEWAAWLPRDWNRPDSLLSADGLTELRTLLAGPTPAAAGAREPRVEQVAAVLARITQPDAPRGGWWARFKRWLREVLAPPPERADRGWVRRLFADLNVSQAVLEGIAWGALALVVALAGGVLVNELRVAGLLKGRQRRPARALVGPARPAARTLLELERASPSQQPRLLLELVTARLGEQERLPPARALTVHELTRAAQLPQESDRDHLEELATVCERVRFSDRETPPHMLTAAVAHGRELLAALEAPPPQPQGAR
jgi:hypothetical protein